MNKDKAIQLLERLQDPEPYEPMLTKDAYDAIQMAIDALDADGDMISRKAAIEALKQQAETMNEWSNRYAEQRKGILTAVNIVEDLPPAQPAPSQVAKDIARIVENGQDMRVIAQPEIIRCKDCKHWIPYDWMFSEVWQSRNINDYPEDEIGCNYCDMAMKANDFCSRGERREVTE